MIAFGFDDSFDGAKELSQVALEINSSELRELAAFLIQCANEMDDDPEWNHEHLCDYLGSELKHDLVIYNSSINK